MNKASGKKLTASQEDYLEAIWELIWVEGVARVSDIAERLDVSMPSVTGALKGLAKRELVEYTPHKYVTLTDRGMELARKISARHEMLREFLGDILELDEQPANDNACRIEHAVDEIVSRRLAYFVEFVSQDARARKFVDRFKGFCQQQEAVDGGESRDAGGEQAVTLADIKAGRKAKVIRVGAPVTAKRKFADAGVTDGSMVSVVRIAPLGDPIEIEVGGRTLAIHKTEAREIVVEEVA